VPGWHLVSVSKEAIPFGGAPFDEESAVSGCLQPPVAETQLRRCNVANLGVRPATRARFDVCVMSHVSRAAAREHAPSLTRVNLLAPARVASWHLPTACWPSSGSNTRRGRSTRL
jgi:hypothetical protein